MPFRRPSLALAQSARSPQAFARGALGALAMALAGSVAAQTIVDDWAQVKAPPAPELKAATVDAKTTALLMLDFVTPNCSSRPRCMASLPAMARLLADARAKGMLVVFATGPTGKRADILPAVAPLDSEAVVSSGVDKFVNTDLEKMLKDAGIQTVIATGTAAQGAVLYTASAASLRGLKVVLPVDGMSSDLAYSEQYVAYHMTTAPLVSRNVTLTRLDQIRF